MKGITMRNDPDHDDYQRRTPEEWLEEAKELAADHAEMYAKYIVGAPLKWAAMDPNESCPQCHGRGEVRDGAYIAECEDCHGVGAKSVIRIVQ